MVRKLNRHLKVKLDKLKFKCPYVRCEKEFAYMEALDHLNDCKEKPI